MKRSLTKVVVLLSVAWIILLGKLLHKESNGTCEKTVKNDPVISFNDIRQQNELLKSISVEMKYISSKFDQNGIQIKQWTDMVAPLQQSISELFSISQLSEEFGSRKPFESIEKEKLPERSIEYRFRSVHNQIEDLWYYVQSWKHAKNHVSFIEDVQSRKNAVLVELELLQLVQKDTGHQKLNDMRHAVETKIRQLQEPRNCSSVKKLLCGLGSACGFGCQLHHVAICFTLAIGMGRTLILDSSEWAYSKNPWEAVFRPISNTSCKANVDDAVVWTSDMAEKDIQVFSVVKVNEFQWQSTPPYLPLRIPKYLYKELTRYHGDPPTWWMGHLVSYLIRPQPWLSIKISEAQRRIGLQSPIAGIHIRRTDKIKSEAAYHDLTEYMVHVADWFGKESMKRQRMKMPPLEKKRVYIASDDPTVLDEARNRYPDYEFLGDKRISMIDNAGGRYSLTGVIGLMTDVTLLSKCDLFVGTFSSGMSRLVYELMQVHHADPSSNVRSLDDRYYYVNQFDRQQRAIYDHDSHIPNEISMKIGDIVATRGDHWDGFSLGTNTRTNKEGLYPSYKTEDIITAADFNF